MVAEKQACCDKDHTYMGNVHTCFLKNLFFHFYFGVFNHMFLSTY